MTYPPIYVLRHGETYWNAEGRFQGVLPSQLNDNGKAHAARQARLLSGLDLDGFDVRVSPQGRAFETAAIAVARRVAFLHTDERLREIEVGDWSGMLYRDVRDAVGFVTEDTPDGSLALFDHAPNGEGFAALRARCTEFLETRERPTICVTHGITSRMLRCIAMGRPSAELADLPGGQGNVHIVENGVHRTLSEGVAQD